jgi:hopanoid-associated phosphorylase
MAYEAHFVDTTLAQTLLGESDEPGQTIDHSTEDQRSIIIAFVGMAFEARIAAGPGVLVFSRDRRDALALAAENATRHGYRGIISFGVAGGLTTSLRPGDWVVASAILQSQSARPTDAAWSKNLLDAIGGAHYAPIVGVDLPVADPAEKRELHRKTGAVAADMESHMVAELAAAHGLAFAALRVIVDPAERAIPRAALAGIGTGARADGAAVLRDLVSRPSQLPSLIRVSFDAFIARSEMVRVRRLLGPHFGLAKLPPMDLISAELAGATPYRSPA